MEALASAFCTLGFALVDDTLFVAVEMGDDEEAAEEELLPPAEREGRERFASLDEAEAEDFILASSASKAGARVLTTASRSDCFDKDWTSEKQSIDSVKKDIEKAEHATFISFLAFVCLRSQNVCTLSNLFFPTVSLPVSLHFWIWISVEGMISLRTIVCHGFFLEVIVWCHFSLVVIVGHGFLEMAFSLHFSLASTFSHLSFLARIVYHGSLNVTDAERR